MLARTLYVCTVVLLTGIFALGLLVKQTLNAVRYAVLICEFEAVVGKALLALFGDLGCTSGPAVVGKITEIANGQLNTGLLFAVIFPALLITGLFLLRSKKEN